MATCACPGCEQPGTSQCSACKATPYCGTICQTADWPHHKEECPGHLRKVGMTNLMKARGFFEVNNYVQTLRYAELASKLKLLKDRPLEAIDLALSLKTASLEFLGRYREAMENAKERYTMWAMTNIRNPRSIRAAFDLIDCCLLLDEKVDAELFARTAYEIINQRTDNIIPLDQRQHFLARGAHYLAKATYELAKAGGIAPEAKQAAGMKAIALLREALEIDTQLYGAESGNVAGDISVLAQALAYFNDEDDNEVLRLYERAKAIFAQVQGSSSMNVAACEQNLGVAHLTWAMRAEAVNDPDRYVANLQLALPHYREAARISTNHADRADAALRTAAGVEELLRLAEISRAEAAAAAVAPSSAATTADQETAAAAAAAAAAAQSRV